MAADASRYPDPDALDCIELVELVTEYLDGALEPAERDRLERHLAACDGCTAYVAQFRATIAGLRAGSSPMPFHPTPWPGSCAPTASSAAPDPRQPRACWSALSTSRQARSTSPTPQAWAMQPRGTCGGPPSKISEIVPSPASRR